MEISYSMNYISQVINIFLELIMSGNDYSLRGFNNWRNYLLLILVTVYSACLNFANLGIGLPSNERLKLEMGGRESVKKILPELLDNYHIAVKSEFIDKSPENLVELAKYSPYFDQLRSTNPDEFHVFKVLAGMYERGDPLPRSYIYGSFFFYQMAFPLAVARLAGYIDQFKSPGHYMVYPEEFRPFYFSVRFLCALFQTLAVTVTFMAAWRIFKTPGAVFSAMLMASLPLVTVGAQFIKADPPVLFWSTLALFFAIPILKRSKRFDYWLAGVCAGLAAATKYPALFTFSYILMFHLLRRQEECGSWRGLRPDKKDLYLLESLGASIITGLFASLPMLFDIRNFFESYSYHMRTSREGNLLFNLVDTFINYWHDAIFLTYGFAAALLILIGLVLIFIKRQRIWFAMLPLVVFYFYTAAKGLQISDMYTLPAIPALCMIGCYAWEQLKHKTIKYIAGAIIIVITFSYSLAYIQCGYRENGRATASRWIQENIPPGSSLGAWFFPVSYRFPMVPPDKYKFITHDVNGDQAFEADYYVNCSFNVEREPFWTRLSRGESFAPPSDKPYELAVEIEDIPRALFGLIPLRRNYYVNYYFEVYRPKFSIYRRIRS